MGKLYIYMRAKPITSNCVTTKVDCISTNVIRQYQSFDIIRLGVYVNHPCTNRINICTSDVNMQECCPQELHTLTCTATVLLFMSIMLLHCSYMYISL